jgi:hypothetical protein
VPPTSLILCCAHGVATADDTIEALAVLDDGTLVATPGMQGVLR